MLNRNAPSVKFPHICKDGHTALEVDVSDFSFTETDLSLVPHFYCHKCKAHSFRGKFFTEKQWEDYINSPI